MLREFEEHSRLEILISGYKMFGEQINLTIQFNRDINYSAEIFSFYKLPEFILHLKHKLFDWIIQYLVCILCSDYWIFQFRLS